MTQKIEFELAANDTSAKAAWERQQKAINAVIEKLGKMEDASAKAGKTQEGWVGKGVGKLAGMAAGYLSVTGAISGVIAANKQMIDQADEAALKYDDLFRKINVQAGVRGVAAEANKTRILDVALRNASTVEEATATAQQLAGAGFSPEDASGGALDVMLKGFAGTGQAGTSNAGQLTQSATQFLSAMKLERNAGNLERVIVAMQQAYRAGDLQMEDLTQVAAKSSGLAGKLTPEETLAAFSTMRESMTGDQASTGLKIVAERLMGAGEDDTRKGLLKRMGMKATDVDLVGESIKEVLDRMSAGVEKLPEAERAGVMQKFFGSEAASAATKLIRDRSRMGYYEGVMADRAAFAGDAAEAQTGKAADRRRLGLMAERDAASKDTGAAEMLSAADIIAARKGLSPAMRAYSRFKASTMQGLGFSPETAIGSAYGSTFGVKPDGGVGYLPSVTTDEIKKLLAENIKASKDAMRAVEKAAAKEPIKIVKPDVPVRPVSTRAGVSK